MSIKDAKPRKHGTLTMYVKGGCRCEPCRQAKIAYVERSRAQRSWIDGAKHGREATYGYGCRCQPCKDAAAAARRRRKYGTSAPLEDMLAAQGGACASCGTSTPGSKNGWHTDHDHATGAVRGILCGPCNLALGHSKEDPERLRGLADYIEKHTPRKIGF